jgi:precorrin-3B methylase
MSEQVVEEVDDLTQPAPDGELVHWMDPKPIQVGPGGVTAAAVGAFALGVGVTLAVLALSDWLSPERVAEVRRTRLWG